LADRLGQGSDRHRLLTLFRSEDQIVGSDISLDVPHGIWRRLGLDPRALARLRRALRDERPDVVLAHGGEPAKYAAFALSGGTPLVYLSIGSAHPRLDRRLSRWLRDRYTSRADVIVTVSNALANEAVAEGIPAGKIVVIPNGRDASRYAPGRSEMSHAHDEVSLIWVGQLDKTKRPELFIEAVGRLRSEGISVRGSIVGDGPRRDELEQAASASGITLLGTRNDVPELLAASDLFVFTGEPPEGMPGVLIEAGLAGLPVVSTRVPGADEVIEDGETGILVDVDDREGLMLALRRLVGDHAMRHEMGLKARARCVEKFSMEKTLALWRDVLSGLTA
jgi:glycosyltransferase involved in cell wall biosynthesis